MLYVGVVGIGLAYGSLMAISPLYIGEFFGSQFFGGNWALARVSPGLGSFFFSTLLAGGLYDRYAGANSQCIGRKCYQTTFLITSAVCFVMIICSIVLSRRARKTYSELRSTLSQH